MCLIIILIIIIRWLLFGMSKKWWYVLKSKIIDFALSQVIFYLLSMQECLSLMYVLSCESNSQLLMFSAVYCWCSVRHNSSSEATSSVCTVNNHGTLWTISQVTASRRPRLLCMFPSAFPVYFIVYYYCIVYCIKKPVV